MGSMMKPKMPPPPPVPDPEAQDVSGEVAAGDIQKRRKGRKWSLLSRGRSAGTLLGGRGGGGGLG